MPASPMEPSESSPSAAQGHILVFSALVGHCQLRHQVVGDLRLQSKDYSIANMCHSLTGVEPKQEEDANSPGQPWPAKRPRKTLELL